MRTNLKKFMVFVLSLAMVITAVPMVAFAASPYTVGTNKYDSGVMGASYTSNATAYLMLDNTTLTGPTTIKPESGSYFTGELISTPNAFVFTGASLYIASGDAVTISDTTDFSTHVAIDVYGVLNLNCSYVGEITVHQGGFVVFGWGSHTERMSCTIKGDCGYISVHDNGNAHIFANISGEFAAVFTDAPGTAPNSADFDYVNLIGPTTVGSINWPVGTWNWQDECSEFNILNTSGYALALDNGATAWLYDDDCKSTIDLYDATLHVCADQLTGDKHSPKFEDVTFKDTIIIGHGEYIPAEGSEFYGPGPDGPEFGGPRDGSATSAAVLYVDDNVSNSAMGVCIKGCFKKVETAYVENNDYRDFVVAEDDTIICSSPYSEIVAYGHPEKSTTSDTYYSNNNMLWLLGEKSFYDVIGDYGTYDGEHHDMTLYVGEHNVKNAPIVNAAGYFSDVNLENGYLNYGYLSGVLDHVIGYAYEVQALNQESATYTNFFDAYKYLLTNHQAEMLELQSHPWWNSVYDPWTGVHVSGGSETNLYILSPAEFYDEIGCVVGASSLMGGYNYVDQEDGGYLLWNEEDAYDYRYVDFPRVDGARVAGTFQKITTSTTGDSDVAVMCGPTHIKEGENYIYTGDYCLSEGGYGGMSFYWSEDYDDYEDGIGWNLTLGSNASDAAIGHIVSFHTGSFDGVGNNPLLWPQDCDTLGTVRVYGNATADVLGVVDNYPISSHDEQGVVATQNVGFLHKMNPHRHSLSIEEIVGYGGSVKISTATHSDIYYDGGDTYRYVEDVANVMIPTIRGDFANADGLFIQSTSLWKKTLNMTSGSDVLVDVDDCLLNGSTETVLVGTQLVEEELSAPVNVKLAGHADTLVVSSGVITVEGSANEIIINGGTVILSGANGEDAVANKVTVNGGKFIMGNDSVVEAVIGETDTESVAVKVQPTGSFYMYNGLIKLSQPTNNHKDLVMVGVENNGTAILSNGEIVIKGGTVNNSAVLNSSKLVVGYYGEYDGTDLKDATSWMDRLSGKWISTAGDSSLNISMDTGIGIDNAAVTSETYVYDTNINIEHGIGIDAVNNYDSKVNAGKLYILSGDRTVKDATVNCQGFYGNNSIVNKVPEPTVIVNVNGADAIALNIGPNTQWTIAGPYLTSRFNAATALRVNTTYRHGTEDVITLNSIPTGGLEPAYYNPYSWGPYHGKGYDVLRPLSEDIKVLDRPLECGLFIGEIEFYDHQSSTPQKIDIDEFIPEKNFRVLTTPVAVSLVTDRKLSTVVDEQWMLRYALENITTDSSVYVLQMNIQLDLYQDAHGMCNLGDIDISYGTRTLDLNGHTLTGEAGKDVLHLVRNTGAKLYIKGTGTISASGIHADAVYVEGGELYVQSNAVLDANGTEANSVYVNGGYAEIVDGRYNDNVYIQSGELVVKGGTFNGDVVKAGGNVHLHAGKYNGAIENRTFGGNVAHVTNNDVGMIQTNHELFANNSSVQTNVKKIEAVSGGMVLSKMNIKTLLDSPVVKLLYNIDLNEPDCTECGLDSKYGEDESYTWTITTEKSLDLNGFVLTNSNTIGDTIVVNEGGNLTLKAGAKNGGKILSYNDSKNDSLFVDGGKLTVEGGFNGYVYQLHVLDIDDSNPYKSNVVVNGGEYGMVYASDSSNSVPTAPIYKVLPNNLDWYNLATGNTYVRNVAFSSVTELPHAWGVNYTVTSAAHSLTLDSNYANFDVAEGTFNITATQNPSNARLTWQSDTANSVAFTNMSTGENPYYKKINAEGISSVATLNKTTAKATVSVWNEYGDKQVFSINCNAVESMTMKDNNQATTLALKTTSGQTERTLGVSITPSNANQAADWSLDDKASNAGITLTAIRGTTTVVKIPANLQAGTYKVNAVSVGVKANGQHESATYTITVTEDTGSGTGGGGGTTGGGGGFSGGGGGGSVAPVIVAPTKVETVWKDVDTARYYYDAMQWAFDEGIMEADETNKFGIGDNVSRAEFFNSLYKAAGSPRVSASATTPFKDVAKTADYYNAVVWAVTEGLTNGAGANDVFAPDMELDRAQIVTILWRYSGSKEQAGKINFTDVEKGRYYEKAVDWSTANGIINGTGDGTTFSPKEFMLKESAITMLYRKFVKALF